MRESDAFNAQLPVDAVESLGLHYFAVLFQHLLVDEVRFTLVVLEVH
jgi:hypothetical protein